MSSAGTLEGNQMVPHLEGLPDLISSLSPYMKIQIKGGKIVQNSGVQIPAPKGQIFLLFFFNFQIPLTKLNT